MAWHSAVHPREPGTIQSTGRAQQTGCSLSQETSWRLVLRFCRLGSVAWGLPSPLPRTARVCVVVLEAIRSHRPVLRPGQPLNCRRRMPTPTAVRGARRSSLCHSQRAARAGCGGRRARGGEARGPCAGRGARARVGVCVPDVAAAAPGISAATLA
eukprot:354169-Chlamydomonas_euryale.AAC.11